jgi:NitT/TauT family transport system substrate-binding protein
MLMSDHGVELYGNVLLVSPKFAADKPEAVKGFIKALTKACATPSPIRLRPPLP